jgi:hypothetical protein
MAPSLLESVTEPAITLVENLKAKAPKASFEKITEALDVAKAAYTISNPNSAAINKQASLYTPGGQLRI